MGTPDFAASVLERVAEEHEIVLVVTQPDRVNGRGGKVTVSEVKAWAVEHDVPVFQPEKIRKPEAIEELKKYDFEIAVVAAFGQILPPAVLDMPRYGCVNVHASLLPKYRGAAPIQWAVINGDEETGVTTMQMGPGLDDGDILLQESVPISSDETGGSLFDKLAVTGGELILKTLAGIEAGTITPVQQDETKATHVGMIKKDMGNLDFAKGAAELERLVRGLSPWPSAYTFLDGKMLKIWKADVCSALPVAENSDNGAAGESALAAAAKTAETLAPGTCVREGNDLYVAAGEGFLKLLEVQMQGKKRMAVSDFLRGHDIKTGFVLGNKG